MRTQTFKNYIGSTHERELSKLLNVPMNTLERKGVDLIDSNKGVEVKSCIIYPESDDSRKNISNGLFLIMN